MTRPETKRRPGRPGGALAAAGLLALGAAVAVPVFTSSCANPESRLYMTVERYLSAIIQRDDEGMALVWGPFRREVADLTRDEYGKHLAAFSVRVQQGHQLYERAKREGSLAPDALGIPMFRAFGLGKGAVSLPLSARIEEDGASARVRTRVVTNLETLHLDALPDGVRIYLMGYPVGNLEMISVGFDELTKHHLLESVDIEWRLSRAPEIAEMPTGWAIESLAADPNSAVEWKPKGKK